MRFLASDNDTVDHTDELRAAVIVVQLHSAKWTRHRRCVVCAFAETFIREPARFLGENLTRRTARRDISKSLIDQLAELRHAVNREELVVPDFYFFMLELDI